MVSDPIVRWVFTLLFAALALHALRCMITTRSRPLAAVGHAWHLLMAVGMAVMAWPAWTGVPSLPQLVLFLMAAVWFAAMLILTSSPRTRSHNLAGHGPGHQLMHAVMMLSMVWMILVMDGHEPMSDPATPGGHGEHSHAALSPLLALSGVAFMAGLLSCGVILLLQVEERLTRPRSSRAADHSAYEPVLEAGAAAAMCFGMAAMCWPMLLI